MSVSVELSISSTNGTPSHTLNPVDVIYLARDAHDWKIVPEGILSDIAPTVLELLGLPVPEEMTAHCLLRRTRS